jgi:hypothetical protein
MSARSRIATFLGRMLERSGTGAWIAGRPKCDGLYLLLFGRGGEELAGLLPTRGSLGHESGPVIVGLADRPGTLTNLTRSGHVALNAAPCRTFGNSEAWLWLFGLLQHQFNFVRPRGILYTPEFVESFPRARRFTVEVAAALRRRGESLTLPFPAFIAPELTLGFQKSLRLIDQLNEDDPGRHCLRIYHYGHPDYFDYAQYLSVHPNIQAQPLGWRLEDAPEPERALGRRGRYAMHILLRSPLARRELLRELEERLGPERIERITVHDAEGSNPAGGPIGATPVRTLQEFMELAMHGPELVVTDGAFGLLPLLAARRPAVLLAAGDPAAPAMLRRSYFLGEERWPGFGGARELAQALAASDPATFWIPYADRASRLEHGAENSFARQFREQLLDPLAAVQ